MTNSHEEFVENVIYAEKKVQLLRSHCFDARKVISNYEGENKYVVALGFYQMAHQTYLHLAEFYRNEISIRSSELEDVLNEYEAFQINAREYIRIKDNNPSWLDSSFDKFKRACDEYAERVKVLKEDQKRLNKNL